jgi:hypothetical protein
LIFTAFVFAGCLGMKLGEVRKLNIPGKLKFLFSFVSFFE